MGIGFNISRFFKRREILHEKDIDGINWYYQDGLFSDKTSNIEMALNHPILTPAILFITRLMCQAEVVIEHKNSNKKEYNHDFLKLINNPNPLQTRDDFITEIEFQKIANGIVPIYKKAASGMLPESLYVLDVNCFKDTEEIDTSKILWKKDLKQYLNTKLKYDDGHKKFTLRIKDLIFIKDIPNSKKTNLFNAYSRVDGIKQTLINTNDSLIAKNIVLKTNGKELLTAGKGGLGSFPMSPEEKGRVEKLVNKKYGVSFNRVRTIVSQTNLTWKSMHIALRDLGLDESLKIDSDIVFTALHIPKDIYSINNKKAAYKNFTESMVGFVQNNIKQEVDYIVHTIYQDLYNDYSVRVFSEFGHMPIMKKSIKERYDGVKSKALALQELLSAGIPDKLALQECGFDENIVLTPKKNNTDEN